MWENLLLQTIDSTTSISITVIIACGGVLGAGFSSYIGVKIAIAEVKKDIGYNHEKILSVQKEHDDDIEEIRKRLDRLESGFFGERIRK